MKKTAFTLIELLVVIVIIGILATISVAQFNNYQVRARHAKIQVNMQTLERAFQLYYIDHEDYTIPNTGATGYAGYEGMGSMRGKASSPGAYYAQTSIMEGLQAGGYLSVSDMESINNSTYSYLFYVCSDSGAISETGKNYAIYAFSHYLAKTNQVMINGTLHDLVADYDWDGQADSDHINIDNAHDDAIFEQMCNGETMPAYDTNYVIGIPVN